MSLYTQLQAAKSEEDVKDAYIKALGLKGYTKGLIDIQAKEIWFEAKDTGKNSSYAMFTQLLHYVQDALNKGESVPPFLAVIDTDKAALMKSSDVIPFLAKKTIKWGKSASQYTPEALDEISAHIGTHFVSFKIATHEDEFIQTVKAAIKTGDIIRTQITPDNLKQVFDKWVEMVGREINGVKEEDYALLFFADIMNDGTVSTHTHLPAELLHKSGEPVFALNGRNFELGNKEGYPYQMPSRSQATHGIKNLATTWWVISMPATTTYSMLGKKPASPLPFSRVAMGVEPIYLQKICHKQPSSSPLVFW